MKLVLDAAARGYTGTELQDLLRRDGIECEFADRQYLVCMPSAETTEKDWSRLLAVLRTVPKKDLALYGWDANPFVWRIEFERIEEGGDNR